MKQFFKNNGLSIVFFLFFVIAIFLQAYNGWKEYNQQMMEEGQQQISISQYLTTGDFIEAVFENWESEFLQMALFVSLSMFLYQKGSSESKDPDKEKEEVDREPNPKKKDAPWPVKAGGLILSIYKHSLCYILYLLFILSFCLHWYGSLEQFNRQQILKGMPTESAMEYLSNAKFWAESFENWQSEFLSVFAIVILSIWFRQKGSPQSKPVDAPHSETGG